MTRVLAAYLEETYRAFHRPETIHPDPLEVPRRYPFGEDREVTALLAALYAYGRVRQILTTLDRLLAPLGPRPASVLRDGALPGAFCAPAHRFTSCEQTLGLLAGTGAVLREFGSLEGAFLRGGVPTCREDLLEALEGFAALLAERSGTDGAFLLPRPSGKSACKRWFLFLRWMVREDEVDPGGWRGIPRSALVVPLDAHMFRFGREWGLIRRASPDLKSALELTEALAAVDPQDPVRFDFSLTRRGILGEGTLDRSPALGVSFPPS
ncbi:conserved hypothetical protein [Aminomonas paucivorans DSM 12260]|uniref:TIGR02757 family protein n=1 Tax=Aminomonas paucivorans DSM 12260 TaxID=584708 RepID=E3CZY6_9BACT|nr:TIGR02757 family protein [Aminomonas paucivorans]EFQ22918.1 conserved hypothetical protein [Aminomonas paucivorans DSM 12260]